MRAQRKRRRHGVMRRGQASCFRSDRCQRERRAKGSQGSVQPLWSSQLHKSRQRGLGGQAKINRLRGRNSPIKEERGRQGRAKQASRLRYGPSLTPPGQAEDATGYVQDNFSGRSRQEDTEVTQGVRPEVQHGRTSNRNSE